MVLLYFLRYKYSCWSLAILFRLVRHNSLLGANFNALYSAWGSYSAFRRGNFIYDSICSLGLCFLDDRILTHLGRPGSSNSAIDLFFCSLDFIWILSWSTLNDSYGSDHFPIIISINRDILIRSNLMSHTNNNLLLR